MENDVESLISQEEKKEALRREQGYFKISGIIYGPLDENSANESIISGITVRISGKFLSQNLITGINGEFESGELPEGKYTLSFQDPSQKYFRSPVKLNLLKDIYSPVHLSLPGADKKGKSGKSPSSAISGIVLNRQKKPISGATVSIKSVVLEKNQNLLRAVLSKIFPFFKKGQEQTVSIELTTNILGMFSVGRSLPKGSYIVKCSDKEGKYRFSSKFIVIRDKSAPFIVFTGYSESDLEELRKKFEEEKEAQKDETEQKTEETKPEQEKEETIEKLEQLKRLKEKEAEVLGQKPKVRESFKNRVQSKFSNLKTRVSNVKISSPLRAVPRINFLRPVPNLVGRGSSFALRGGTGLIRGGLTGATSAINYMAQGIKMASVGVRAAAGAAALVSNPAGWVVAAVAIGIVLFIIIFMFFFKPSSVSTPGFAEEDLAAPGGGMGNIASCTFYRGGDPVPGRKFGNPEMAQFVDSVSAKVGVPASVVAGIMRVESGNKLVLSDPSYFAADYDDTSSGVAYGIMQFTPGTFIGTFSRNATELNNLFNKTDVRAEIDPPGTYPSNYFRIYSIRDSITATAFKVKNDKQSINGDGPWDQATIYEIARRYYGCLQYGLGGCTSGPYNYGEDVWKSYSECKAAPATEMSINCPLDPVNNSAYVTCGTATNPVNLCGHGGIGYAECSSPPYVVCPYSEQLKNAIDIVTANGVGSNVPVYLPPISGNTLQWKFVKSEFLNAGWGFRQVYNSQFNGRSIDLELTHLNEQYPPTYALINSGAQIATTHSIAGHLHTGVVIDGKPVDPISDLFMCTGNRL